MGALVHDHRQQLANSPQLYEIARETGQIRILILLANVAIVFYLFRRKDVFE